MFDSVQTRFKYWSFFKQKFEFNDEKSSDYFSPRFKENIF